MVKEYKKKWIEALRSGNYKQGKFALKRDNRYCCLGVLCNIHPEVEEILLDTSIYYKYKKDESNGYLPDSLCRSMKIKEEEMTKLTEMNDHNELNFDQIADWIENNL